MEIARRVVGRADVGVEEEVARVLVGPVGREGVFVLRVGFDMGDYAFEGAVVADQLEGGVRADFGDRIEVVAAEKYAEVDELGERLSEFV